MNEPIIATCGRCIFWKFVEEPAGRVTIGAPKRGNCYGVPPTPYPAQVDRTGRIVAQGNMRAVCPESEPACGLFVDAEMAQRMQSANN
jgi:hypothetical protein